MYFNFCFSSAWFLLTQVWKECTGMSKANEHLKNTLNVWFFWKVNMNYYFFKGLWQTKVFEAPGTDLKGQSLCAQHWPAKFSWNYQCGIILYQSSQGNPVTAQSSKEAI